MSNLSKPDRNETTENRTVSQEALNIRFWIKLGNGLHAVVGKLAGYILHQSYPIKPLYSKH